MLESEVGPGKTGQRSYIEQSILSEVFADTDFSSKKSLPSGDEKEEKDEQDD